MARTPTTITDRPIRFALVGCGRIAENHFAALEKHAGRARLVAVCDTDAAALAKACQRTGTPGYANLDLLLSGSDADIVVLDPTKRGTIRQQDLHESDYSPWEGHAINAWPVVTIQRGKVMVEGGKYLGKFGDGQHLKRKIPSDIIAGPTL